MAAAFALVLHTHLPYVIRHGRWPHGSDWLCEAAAESYLPLLRVLERRATRGGPALLTLSLTPVLCEQLADPEFPAIFRNYLEEKHGAAREDRARFQRDGDLELTERAAGWEGFYRGALEDFLGAGGANLVARFRRLEERGVVEIVTSAATHAYLPLMGSERAISRQLRVATRAHRRHFGRAPRGMWLPECAWRPAGSWVPPFAPEEAPSFRRGLESWLEDEGLCFCFVDPHLLLSASDTGKTPGHAAREGGLPDDERGPVAHPTQMTSAALPPHSPSGSPPPRAPGSMARLLKFAPSSVARAPISAASPRSAPGSVARSVTPVAAHDRGMAHDTAAFGIANAGATVRSVGAGAADLFHAHRVAGAARLACVARDPATAFQVWSGTHGYPGDGAYLEFHKKRDPGGLRYWAVTDSGASLDDKQRYAPTDAASRVAEHARHFAGVVRGALAADAAPKGDDAPPLLAALFDTELFGHWWFEGPAFLESALEEIEHAGIEPVAIEAWLERHPPIDAVSLGEGSWGEGGDHRMWWNEGTREAWRAIHAAARRFEALALRAAGAPSEPLLERLLAQSAREVLLLEASDWTFLITSGAARDYAERRILEHAADAALLSSLIERRIEGAALSAAEVEALERIERRDALFPDLQWREAAGL